MSIVVDGRTVRQSGRALRQAASELKGSMRRARGERTESNVQEVEASRADLREALAMAALVKRQAMAQGLEVTNLSLEIAEAEKRLDDSPSDGTPVVLAASLTPPCEE